MSCPVVGVIGVLKYVSKSVVSLIPGPDQLNVRLSPPTPSSITILMGYLTPPVSDVVADLLVFPCPITNPLFSVAFPEVLVATGSAKLPIQTPLPSSEEVYIV